jgi:hypothetical protein
MTLLVLGPILLVIGVVYETRTTRVAVLPSTLFKSRTEGKPLLHCDAQVSHSEGTVVILIVSFFHNVALNAGTFYLAIYYQVRVQTFWV